MPGGPASALLARIQALQSKTTDRGCTEQEAMSAAAKVAELLDRHSLLLSDLELQAQPCARAELATGRSRIGPLDECGPAVAAYFDCRPWFETDTEGRLRHVFFGLPGDVQAAVYLMRLVAQAFETEANRFRASPDYTRGRGGRRRALHTSFVLGLSQGIQARLQAMRTERDAAVQGSSGRSLVLAKAGVVDAEMARLGLRFRTRNPAEPLVDPAAYGAGHDAGQRFEAPQALERDQG
ncbi:MAG: DUF7168 domain-containing protein [Janthinobacterium lividum]